MIFVASHKRPHKAYTDVTDVEKLRLQTKEQKRLSVGRILPTHVCRSLSINTTTLSMNQNPSSF